MKIKQKIISPAEGGNPRAQPFKQIEMSIKRAYQLNTGLIDSLHTAGSITNLKHTRMWCITINKDLRDVFNLGAYGKEDPAVHHQDVWEWVIDHWYSHGLKRSVEASMDNLTETNKANIKNKISELR